ncbi:hypothetical protein C0J52_25427 [Blattella germanica]|nr:hypothetical protein C0J52_25427 [Blattella germanica]
MKYNRMKYNKMQSEYYDGDNVMTVVNNNLAQSEVVFKILYFLKPNSLNTHKIEVSLSMTYLHSMGDEFRDVASVFLLRVSHEAESAVVYFDDEFAAVFCDYDLEGADVQSTKQFRYFIHPHLVAIRHLDLLQHC